MVLIAFSLQDQVEKYGAYVGIAAFFGLAILTLLYFAQAREVKRLREWAGRAPERAAELEQAVPSTPRRCAAPPRRPFRRRSRSPSRCRRRSPPRRTASVKLKPEEVAALAFARAAGVHEPHEPKAHPVAAAPVAAAAVAEPETEVAAAGPGRSMAATATRAPCPRRSRPPRAAPSPAAAPAPAAPRDAPPAAVPPPPPPQREGSGMLAVILTAVDRHPRHRRRALLRPARRRRPADDRRTRRRSSDHAHAGAGRDRGAAKQTPAPTKQTALIAVYNGTVAGRPRRAAERTCCRQDGYPKDNLGDRHRAAGAAAPDVGRDVPPRQQGGRDPGRPSRSASPTSSSSTTRRRR